MSSTTAVRSALGNCAGFRGRAGRAEFWWFALFCGLVAAASSVVDSAVGSGALRTATSLLLLLPSLAVSVRRLHDAGRSGGWWFTVLVPLAGWIVLLVLQCRRGDAAANRFGAPPVPSTGFSPRVSDR